MTAILFGSIGSLADTSELQRDAFNAAFAQHDLDWHWDQAEYQELLQGSGGAQRIADYAERRGETVDADAIHATKSEIFRARLREHGVAPRPGVVETLHGAARDGVSVGFITTTSPENVTAIGEALAPAVDIDAFSLVLNLDDVQDRKPAPDVYRLALERLSEAPEHVVAIEDNVGGVEAAVAAGIPCVAFPGENNAAHDFSAASERSSALSYDAVVGLAG